MLLPNKKSPRFGTKKSSHRSKLQLARAANSKRAETARKPDDKSHGHAVPRAEGDDLMPRPGPSVLHEVIILLLNGQYKYDYLWLLSNFVIHVHFHQCNGILYCTLFFEGHSYFLLVLQMCLRIWS